MEVTIEISAEEVEKMIELHIKENVLFAYAKGKTVKVRGSSYSGLSAVVTIEDAPIDSQKET